MSAFSIVSICDSQQNDPFHFHTHNHAEIIFVKSGKILFEISGKKYSAQAGDLLLVGRLERHGTHILEGPYHRLCLHVTYDPTLDTDQDHLLLSVIQNPDTRKQHRLSLGPDQAQVEGLMSRIIGEFEGGGPCAQELMGALTQELLVYLYRKMPAASPRKSKQISKKMLLIQQYLDQHFTQPVTVEQIARDYFISPDYLARCFKEMTGYSPKQYLITNRLVYARKLLLTTGFTVEAVAYQSGFSDINNFIRSFRAYYGQSPGQFRQQAMESREAQQIG